MELGTLKRIDLRNYWKHEALDFTPWLAQPENIALLADEVGIEIQVTQAEASVGRYNVDILAEEESTGKKIIIENQLETTDHTHLGQLITYAAGLEAEFVIWIVRQVREEHRQAVDWLNEQTDEHINLFIVRAELWQIENSPPALKFNVICRPNEWKRSVRKSGQDDNLSDTKLKQLEFWQQLKEYAETNHPEMKLRTPRAQHWYDISIGRSDRFVRLITDSQNDRVRCELYIPDSLELYNAFRNCKDRIEAELDVTESLQWMELPEKKTSRIRAVHLFRLEDESTWEDAFLWLIDMSQKFKNVFAKEWQVDLE